MVLSPAFIVFLWHYLTCDRRAVYYGECCCEKSESSSDRSGTNASIADKLTVTRCKACSPFFSRHYLDIYGSNTNNSLKNKPVILFLTGGAYIIGYKMWGTLLARALAPHVLVIVPDYRNYPRVDVSGMISDIDMSIDWVLKNAEEFGVDAKKVVLVGQSAGAHLGGICVVRKVLDRIRRLRLNSKATQSSDHEFCGGHVPLKSSYEATDLSGFVSTSSPHNLVTMKQVFHRHGLSCSVQRCIFGGSPVDGRDASGQDVFEKWSTFHLVKKCEHECTSLAESTKANSGYTNLELKNLFPKLCVIHGTNDKTVSLTCNSSTFHLSICCCKLMSWTQVPVEESIEFLSLLSNLQIPSQKKFYEGWTHTDPILEAPMRGNHVYHKDVYNLVRFWTSKLVVDESEHKVDDLVLNDYGRNADGSSLPDLDEQHPMLLPICPSPLVEIARICNPF